MSESVAEKFTFLEFGSMDPHTSKRDVWDLRLHEEAYDFFMLSRYMKDLVILRRLLRFDSSTLSPLIRGYREGVFTNDLYNAIFRLAALEVMAPGRKDTVTLTEFGSTLLGGIESIAFVQKLLALLGAPTHVLEHVHYLGVDISELLNDVAVEIHPDHEVRTVTRATDLPERADVFFAKGVSLLYGADSLSALSEIFSTVRGIATFDYSMALRVPISKTLGTGKKVTYLTTGEVIGALREAHPDKELYVQTSTSRVVAEGEILRGVFILGNESMVVKTVARANEITRALDAALRSEEAPDELRAVLYYDNAVRPSVDDFERLEDYIRPL